MLVIDEISMLSASLFDTLAYIAQRIRSCMLPFGGLQLVLCGDFFQLPPVKAQRLCFQSERFQHCVKRKIVLKQNFRQKDSKLITILNQIRTGRDDECFFCQLISVDVLLCPYRHSDIRSRADITGNCKAKLGFKRLCRTN